MTKNRKGRPKNGSPEAIAIKRRDADILRMHQKGYPLDYIVGYFKVKKPRIVQIIKKEKLKVDKNG